MRRVLAAARARVRPGPRPRSSWPRRAIPRASTRYFCDGSYANLGEAVANSLQQVGIRVKLRPLEGAAFFSGYAEKKFKNLIQGSSGAGNAATRLEAFVATGGAYVYGGYPDLDGLFQEQAADTIRSDARPRSTASSSSSTTRWSTPSVPPVRESAWA